MKLDSVSYIFSRAELSTLLDLTGGELPFFPRGSEQFDEGVASLEQNFLAGRSEASIVVDKVAALLARILGGSDGCVCLFRDGYYYGLFVSASVSIVLNLRNGQWLVTPYQRTEEALSAFLRAAPRKAEGAELGLQSPSGRWSRPCPETEELKELLRTAADRAIAGEPPAGKEEMLWKP